MLMKNNICQGDMVNLKYIQYPPPFWSKNERYDSGIKGITTIYGLWFKKNKRYLAFHKKN